MKIYVILHNIRSAHNVGSIFRTADGAGVIKIYLTGYTPSPIDRFGRIRNEIKKTSLGATESVPYENVHDARMLIYDLKKLDVEIVAVEQTERACDYRAYTPTKDTAFIFGNETEGIDKTIQSMADHHIQIPMHGVKESLNVSVCAGIILFAYQ